MRLLNTSTLQLKEFVGKAPPYAILSHTWGDDEVLFQDFQEDPTTKTGWTKVKASCDVARDLHHEWIWIDTCCIDKSSSAELSEAINSMFKWYEEAVVCLAYLSDIQFSDPETSGFAEILAGSRWFTRGWTLQELLAPRHLDFYSSEWKRLGPLYKFAEAVSRKTGIETEFLSARAGIRKRLAGVSVAARMCWASGRRTTRVEDMAYCLLGIFDINMPLIYGEGQKAFKRLQEIIIREIDDQSIFAWGHRSNSDPDLDKHSWGSSLLAGHPSWFKDSGDIIPLSTDDILTPLSIKYNGVNLSTPLWRSEPAPSNPQHPSNGIKLKDVKYNMFMPVRLETWPEERYNCTYVLVAPLKCRWKGDFFNCIAITLRQHSSHRDDPSCHRASHMIYSAPRSTWAEELICRPFIYFHNDYDRWSSNPDTDKGCVIRSIPRAYTPGKKYFTNGRCYPMESIIKCYIRDYWHFAMVPLEGPVPNLTLVLYRSEKNGGMPGSMMRADILVRPKDTTLRQFYHLIHGEWTLYGFSKLNDTSVLTSSSGTQHKLQLFNEFTITVSVEPAYGPSVNIIDIRHPFNENVTRGETKQLDCFTPVRREAFHESDFSRLSSGSRTSSKGATRGTAPDIYQSTRDSDGDSWASRGSKQFSAYEDSDSVKSMSTDASAKYDRSDTNE